MSWLTISAKFSLDHLCACLHILWGLTKDHMETDIQIKGQKSDKSRQIWTDITNFQHKQCCPNIFKQKPKISIFQGCFHKALN